VSLPPGENSRKTLGPLSDMPAVVIGGHPPRVLTELKEVTRYRKQLLTHLQQVENQIEVVSWKLMAKRDSVHNSNHAPNLNSNRNSKTELRSQS